MNALHRKDLYSLEEYAANRPDFRKRVMEHKDNRIAHVGPNVTLHFEDRLTIQYQIQEMLRVERIFEAEGIEEELSAYNPLIPDGTNWKATMMVQYADPDVRKRELARLVGVEDRVWIRVDGCETVFAIADEDLDRATEEKTSSVHFLRFELSPEMIAAVRAGAEIHAGVDHDHYHHEISPLPVNIAESLRQDIH